MRSRRAGFTAMTLLAIGIPPVSAQDPLPAADDLIGGYVEAIGGRSAHLAPTSIRMTGTVEMRAMGIRGSFEMLQMSPDLTWMRIDIPGIGETLSGFDGEVGWSVNPLFGPSLMEGEELEQTRERAHRLAGLRDPELVVARETVGLSDSEGEACWRVRLSWRSGRESFDCYSRETGLLLSSEESQVSPMGTIPVTILYQDYEPIEGMLVATRMVQRVMGQEQEMTIQEMELDSVDPDRLAAPAPVRTLIDPPGGR